MSKSWVKSNRIILFILFFLPVSLFADGSTIETNLDIDGGFQVAISSKTANYTKTVSDHTILIDAASGNITVTLPAASTVTGIIYNIKKIDGSMNTVTVDGNGSETIDDGLTAVLTTQYESISVQNDGVSWWIL